MASRNSCPNSVYNHSGARAERKSVEHSVPNCSESPLATRVEFVDGVAAYPYVFQKIQERIHILTVAADAGMILTAAEYRTKQATADTSGGVTYARIHNSTLLGSFACGLGPGASGSCASFRPNRRSNHRNRRTTC